MKWKICNIHENTKQTHDCAAHDVGRNMDTLSSTCTLHTAHTNHAKSEIRDSVINSVSIVYTRVRYSSSVSKSSITRRRGAGFGCAGTEGPSGRRGAPRELKIATVKKVSSTVSLYRY